MFVRFQVDEVHDSDGFQRVSGRGLAGERFSGDFSLVRLQGHGLTTVPQSGAVGLAVFPGGDRRRGYLLGLEQSSLRPKGTPGGGTVIYGANGEAVSLVQSKVRIVAPDIEIVGNVAITGGTLTHMGKSIGHQHRHSDVMPGSAQTGVPV